MFARELRLEDLMSSLELRAWDLVLEWGGGSSKFWLPFGKGSARGRFDMSRRKKEGDANCGFGDWESI